MSSQFSIRTILVLGDSLCLPRNLPEKVNLNQTWSYLLKNTGQFEIVQVALGGGTVDKLYEQSKYYTSFKPDIVIVQSGIVDCAPRALGKIEKEVINSNRILRFLFHHYLPINLLRKYRNITYTNPREFKNGIKNILKQFSNSEIFWIGIVPANNDYIKSVPGIKKNIDIYNNIIASEIANQNGVFINLKDLPLNGIMSDNHHLNSKGHKWLYLQISSFFSIDSN